MKISLNIDQFLNRIGGFNPGESILLLASQDLHLDFALFPIISYFLENNHKLTVITNRNTDFSSKYKNLHFVDFAEIVPKNLPKFLKSKSLKSKKPILIIDNLTNLSNFGISSKRLSEIYNTLLNFIEKREINLISTLNYTNLNSDFVGILKEASTITLNIFKINEDYLLNTIDIKNRFIPDSFLPIKIKIHKGGESDLNTKFSNIKLEELEKELSLNFFDSELFHRSFWDSVIPMFIFSWNGDFIRPNKKILSLTGLKSNEFTKANILKLISTKERFSVLRNLSLLKSKKSIVFKLTAQTKFYKKLPLDVSIKEIRSGFYLVVLRDISEELRLREKLVLENEKYVQYLNTVAFPIAFFKDNLCIFANDSFLRFIDKKSEEVINQYKLQNLLTKKQVRDLQKVLTQLKLDDRYVYSDVQIDINSQKRICDLILRISSIGSSKLLQLSVIDVTSRTKLIEDLTLLSESYKRVFESSKIALAISKQGVFLHCNKQFLNLFDINNIDDVIGKSKSMIGIQENDIPETVKLKKNIKQENLIFKLKRKDDTEIFLEINSIPIVFQGEEANLEIYQDITNFVNIKNELKQKSQEIEFLNNIIQVINQEIDLEKLSISILEHLKSYLKWDCVAFYLKKDGQFSLLRQDNIPQDFLQNISTLESSEGIGGLVTKTQRPHVYSIKNYPSYLPHKKNFEKYKFNSIALVPTVYKDQVNGLLLFGSFNEIDSDKNTESLLSAIGNHLGNAIHNSVKLSEVLNLIDKYEKLISSISDVIYFGNPSNMFTFVSSNIVSLSGYSSKDFLRNRSMLLSITHPDDRKIVLSRNANLDKISENDVIEYRILPRGKAEYIWIRDSITIIRNQAGEVETVYGILSDVTEKKDLEITLRNTEQFKSGILAGIREGVIVLDEVFNFLDWNDAMEKITGLPRSEVLGRNIFEFPELFGNNLNYYLDQALTGQVVTSEDIAFKIPSTNREGYLWGKFAPLKNNKGDVTGVVAIISDITKRKKLEEEIKNSEQLQRNVLDTIGDFFVLTDLTGKVLQVNKEFVNTMGYSRSEAIGQEFPYPWLLEEEMSKFVIWVSNLRTKNYLHDFDMTWQTKEGKKIAISLNTTLLRNSYGEPIAMLNLARNITDRRKLAKELEERNKLIESINNIIQTANQTTDFEKIFRIFAEHVYNIVPFEKIEVSIIQDHKLEILGSLNKESNIYESGNILEIDNNISKITKIINEPILVSDTNEDERLIIHNIIEDQYLSILSFPIYSEGEIIGTINLYGKDSNAFDEDSISTLKSFVEQMGAIIDRILLFRKVTNDAVYIHNLLNSIDKIIFTVDDQLKLREVNKAWYSFIKKLNLTQKESYTGLYLFDELPESVFNQQIFELSKDILESRKKYASLEFEIKLNQDEIYDYLLTINPMIIEGRVTGEVFTLTDITDLKRTENKLKVLNKQLINLNNISTHISSSFDINKIFKTAFPAIANLLSADYLLFWFTDQENPNEIILRKIYTKSSNSINELNQRENVQGWDYSLPIYASTFNEVPDSLKELILQKLKIKISALASIPIKSAEKISGIFQIFYEKEHDFANQEDQLISMIGNQLGTAIDNAQLYSALQFQLERLSILYDLSQQLTATLDIDQMMQIIHTQLIRIVNFEEMLIKFIDESKLSETTMFHIKTVGNEKIFIPTVIQSVTIQNNSPLWDVIKEKRTIKSLTESGNYYYFPMASKNNVIGTLVLKPAQDSYYDETEIAMIENVCSLVAIAIEKTKLYEETVQKSIEIERRNKELDDFTYVVSHDLKEPLISIEGYSQILHEEYKDILEGGPAEFLESIVKASGRMKKLIDDLLTLSRISRISESFKPVSLDLVLREVETDLSYPIKTKGVHLIKPKLMPLIYGNETQLKILFRNLLSNAIKFSDKSEPIIEIGCSDQDENYYLCYVRDNGIGIEEKYFEKIFVIFQRLHSREEYEGTGAGLAIVKKIVEIHKGKIWVESKPGVGSTFYFTLQKYKNQE